MMSLIKKVRIYGLRTSLIYTYSEINRMIFSLTKKSYSQDGEDLFIDMLLKKRGKGFYVDVGAYDPTRFSNTKRFYDRGWTGINIEPDTINYEKFKKERKRDINLNVGIGTRSQKLTFYKFFPDTLSTFSPTSARQYKALGYKLILKKRVDVLPLSNILKKHCKVKTVDFFSIDTEGLDLTVLKSNNWKLYSPQIICIESKTHRGNSGDEFEKIDRYLVGKGYSQRFCNNVNAIYIKHDLITK